MNRKWKQRMKLVLAFLLISIGVISLTGHFQSFMKRFVTLSHYESNATSHAEQAKFSKYDRFINKMAMELEDDEESAVMDVGDNESKQYFDTTKAHYEQNDELMKQIWLKRKENQRQLDRIFESIKLKNKKTEVPVVVVDQHQEVIPYWFKAINEGIIPKSGNTLIHIDAHSDMAPPDFGNIVKRFQFRQNMEEHEYLPLMQSNDVFIVSAIMKGLLNRIIWIQPDWNENSNRIRASVNYVGLASTVDKDGHRSSCECYKSIYLHKKKKREYQCIAANRRSISEDDEYRIPQSECEKIKKFKHFEMSESRFINHFRFKTNTSVFVDVDEDFFGVESGAENLVQKGIRLPVQVILNEVLNKLYCVTSLQDEGKLNTALQNLMKLVWKKEIHNRYLSRIAIESLIKEKTGEYICFPRRIKTLALFLIEVDEKTLRVLSETQYCLISSSRLSMNGPSGKPFHFGLCSGNIGVNDTLNQIYVSSKEEIIKRSRNLEDILQFVSQTIKPPFYTICRSLRDGYTPRSQQRFIEEKLLESIRNVIRSQGLKERVIYDSQLSFGKEGWPL